MKSPLSSVRRIRDMGSWWEGAHGWQGAGRQLADRLAERSGCGRCAWARWAKLTLAVFPACGRDPRRAEARAIGIGGGAVEGRGMLFAVDDAKLHHRGRAASELMSSNRDVDDERSSLVSSG